MLPWLQDSHRRRDVNRREFGRRAGTALGVLAVTGTDLAELGRHSGTALARRGQQASLRVNGSRALEWLRALAEFGKTPEGGISRVAFSEADRAARDYVAGLMREAGLSVSVDFAGNLIGRKAGSDPGRAPLMMGSHIDSVPSGGNFDGQVGSIGAVEVARTLADNRVALRHPLEVVIFSNEEGGKTGSRALIGQVEHAELDLVTASGHTIAEGLRLVGGDPARLDEVRRQEGDIAAYLELHIEQGALLEAEEVEIGVVEGIVGIKRWNVTIRGFANHAGTTPMNVRRDALVAAARFIEAVDDVASSMPGRQVATVGRLDVQPGVPNVIPGTVTLSLEIRDLEMSKIDRVYEVIGARAAEIVASEEARFTFERFYVSAAAPTARRLRRVIEAAAERLGYTNVRMPSGAGHDAQSIALLGPVGMIFVPSRDGISHSPREFTEPRHVVSGMNVLLHALLDLDRA